MCVCFVCVRVYAVLHVVCSFSHLLRNVSGSLSLPLRAGRRPLSVIASASRCGLFCARSSMVLNLHLVCGLSHFLVCVICLRFVIGAALILVCGLVSVCADVFGIFVFYAFLMTSMPACGLIFGVLICLRHIRARFFRSMLGFFCDRLSSSPAV